MEGEIKIEEVLGLRHDHLKSFSGVKIHGEMVNSLNILSEEASSMGLDFAIASGYRSFDRQLLIWNAKINGDRPVLADDGSVLDINSLSKRELVFSILRWSALPGASRHHWGTDIDVYDAGPSINQGYRLQLSVQETQKGGVYELFYTWLNKRLKQEGSVFFRPYTNMYGGVAPEPWHLSYEPLSKRYQSLLSKYAILDLLNSTDIGLKSVIIANFDEIYDRFILPKGSTL